MRVADRIDEALERQRIAETIPRQEVHSPPAEVPHPMGSSESDLHITDIWTVLHAARERTQTWVKQRAILVKELNDIRDYANGLLYDIERASSPVEEPEPTEQPIQTPRRRVRHRQTKGATNRGTFKRTPAQRRAQSIRAKKYWAEKRAAEAHR